MRKIIMLLIIILFLFLRFYQIDTSLHFFNEMGRDLLVLQEWQERGKPPLLGPQTSALPINQSPIYFYYLYPFYLLTNGSVYTALIANAFLYIIFFIFAFFYFKKPITVYCLLVTFFLISIHPQYIIQSRYIWNPSLVTPFLILGLFSLLYKKPILSAFGFATAISISYSTAPLFIAVLLVYLIYYRSLVIKFILGFGASLFVLNLPVLVFELKYNFQLTRSLFTRDPLQQASLTLSEKTVAISQYLFNTPNQTLNLGLLLFIIILALVILVKSTNHFQKITSLIFLITILITYIAPVTIHAHYIFGLTSILFILLSLLPAKLSLLLAIISGVIFLQLKHLNSYFQPAAQTTSQINKCFTNICQNLKSPLFISVNSIYHPYHNGPEYQYLAKLAGCQVKKLDPDPTIANTMLVVGDGLDFELQKTQYYELTQFGPHQLDSIHDCLPNFKIYQITKTN